MFHKQKIAPLPQANFKWGEFRNREAAGPTATLFRAFHYDGLDKQVTCYYNMYMQLVTYLERNRLHTRRTEHDTG